MAFRPQAGELPNNAQPQWPNYSTAIEICWLKANLDWIYLCANLRRSTLDRCQERRGEERMRYDALKRTRRRGLKSGCVCVCRRMQTPLTRKRATRGKLLRNACLGMDKEYHRS
ncbi:hypothetical protein FOXG_17987 [Fusarium oxysporum f. sp. lycopersici 4287]|uniref:Uncharacterized protein n=3 Tax=Fusarium oxysporum TaxID=5507 RepID=W9IJB9_FUSOX|nr:hypothetical protein FOXG_17987 [Fusarium oxysporum f. sp. lycopersici 4287]EWY92914.1 hypothetical protein FOYG_06329 [Fusarium oxysporum NRRL 32931]EXK49080.1 hypothetical protein FOMG_01742 [Fusarium oxysporum f. sp. melonis 26406]KNA95379.1 hypothetical protein FOXG_17987 [Fusarium oxysporum f. sp. lycopersici 4287]